MHDPQKPFSESGTSTPRRAPTFYVAEITRRRYRGKAPKPVRGPDDVIALVGKRLCHEAREHFLVILLNARHDALVDAVVRLAVEHVRRHTNHVHALLRRHREDLGHPVAAASPDAQFAHASGAQRFQHGVDAVDDHGRCRAPGVGCVTA